MLRVVAKLAAASSVASLMVTAPLLAPNEFALFTMIVPLSASVPVPVFVRPPLLVMLLPSVTALIDEPKVALLLSAIARLLVIYDYT